MLRVPAIERSVELPPDFRAKVPLLVTVPWRVATVLSWTVAVLPVVRVRPFRVLLPTRIVPPPPSGVAQGPLR